VSQENTLVERLKHAMDVKGINSRELAKQAGLGQSFVYDVLKGKSNNPTVRKITAIAQVLNVSVSHLMHGDDMQEKTEGMVSIPELAVHVTGRNSFETDAIQGIPIYFHADWIRTELKADVHNLRVVKVHGDAMEPTIAEGDSVLIDVSKITPEAGVFALFDGVSVNVKRVESVGSVDQPRLRIISDNHYYEPHEAGVSEVNILGRVVWLSRAL
jgi:phage repressor protein C with HTH and peptisase S24 domain